MAHQVFRRAGNVLMGPNRHRPSARYFVSTRPLPLIRKRGFTRDIGRKPGPLRSPLEHHTKLYLGTAAALDTNTSIHRPMRSCGHLRRIGTLQTSPPLTPYPEGLDCPLYPVLTLFRCQRPRSPPAHWPMPLPSGQTNLARQDCSSEITPAATVPIRL